MLLTKRKRNKGNRFSNFHPHNIINSSDRFIRNLSINQLIFIISIGFLLIFGFLAVYLPRESVTKSFVKLETDDIAWSGIPLLGKGMAAALNQRNNIDPDGHIQIFYYPWVCFFVTSSPNHIRQTC